MTNAAATLPDDDDEMEIQRDDIIIFSSSLFFLLRWIDRYIDVCLLVVFLLRQTIAHFTLLYLLFLLFFIYLFWRVKYTQELLVRDDVVLHRHRQRQSTFISLFCFRCYRINLKVPQCVPFSSPLLVYLLDLYW